MMNNRHIRILCVMGTSALLMGTAAGLELQPGPAPITPGGDTALAAALTAEKPLPAYLLTERDGVVAVLSWEGELIRKTDSCVAALPAYDRERLAEGIPVEDDIALAMLLEDYE